MAIQHERWISLEEYHEIERKSDIRYEYSDGRIYDMSGGTFEHSKIALNLGGALNDYLSDKVCQVANCDVKVLPLGDENPSYYPDITVTCDPEDYKRGSTTIRSPHLIIEILSPSTARRDRGEKLRVYKKCASVEEYVMISTRHQEVEVYHRESAYDWHYRSYTAGESVTLASVEFTIPVSKIYIGTPIPPLASALSDD
jgi:Uma2 family endonuclease